MTVLDGAIIVVYFAAIVSFGSVFGRFTRSTRDFFLAGQRFPAWLVAFSCVATVVGSYSFIKYSSVGYRFGVASSQTYLNDWFWMPLFLFGWLPILYFARILSVPEYFRRRFGHRTGVAATVVLLLYLIGYIGINLFTIGKALQTLFGVDLFLMAAVVTALCMVYEWTGGQTSVILTDLFQGALLLVAGLTVAALGLARLGGLGAFVELLPAGFLRPLAEFNDSPEFNFVGIFWQDGLAGGVAFYFMNQGMLMRFMSARSVSTGRRAATIVLIVLMPLAAIAVSGAGWIGAAMQVRGDLPVETAADEVFVIVTGMLCAPGVYGVVLAALLAALMSTADTLINASSALLVNDVYRPFVVRNRSERHYLRAARWTSLLAALAGLGLVPLYARFGTIYEAHGAFTAAITPPMAMALIAAFLWPRFTPAAALATLVGGTAAMFVSIGFPQLVAPFSHGVPPEGGFKYIRACYGVAISAAIALSVTVLSRPRAASEIEGLTIWSMARQRRAAGSDARGVRRRRVRVRLADGPRPVLHPGTAAALGLRAGDEIFVDDARWWLGGLRSVRAVPVLDESAVGADEIGLPAGPIADAGWREGQAVVVEAHE